MQSIICLLRGTNVGGKRAVKMNVLRALIESLGHTSVRTHIQSGNVVFETKERNLNRLTEQLERALEKTFGFPIPVMLRTREELEAVIRTNPFAKHSAVESSKLLVLFHGEGALKTAAERVRAIKADPEIVHYLGRELYVYFPNGVGKTKLPLASLDKAVGVATTGRNWNTVLKLLEIAKGK